MEDKIFELADRLRDKRDRKKQLEEDLTNIKAEIAGLDEALSDAMADANVEKFSRNGRTFYLTTKLFASPLAGRKEELYRALKANGYGSLVLESVNPNTLNSFVREQISDNEDTVPEWLKGVISTYEKVTVGVRKA